MNPFDHAIIAFLNAHAHHSLPFDVFMVFVTRKALLQGNISMALLWWAWFRRGPEQSRHREILLCTLMGAFIAIVAGRALALTLPYRVRPLRDPLLHFVLPYGMSLEEFRGWSAFPSDHAMMFFELATGIFMISRPVGLLLLAHALLVVCLPRVYVGLHFPTDILGGAAIGVLTAIAVTPENVRRALARPMLAFHDRSPSIFYAAMFLLTLGIANMFNDVRTLLSLVVSSGAHGG